MFSNWLINLPDNAGANAIEGNTPVPYLLVSAFCFGENCEQVLS